MNMKIIHIEVLLNNLEIGYFHFIKNRNCIIIPEKYIRNSCMENLNKFCNETVSYDEEYLINSDINENIGDYYDSNSYIKKILSKSYSTKRILFECCEPERRRIKFTDVSNRIEIPHYVFINIYKTLMNSTKSLVSSKLFDKSNFKNVRDYYRLITVNVKLLGYNVIDQNWNKLLLLTCQEKGELDRLLSWLSTLGGAFSSLGEEDEYFANRAACTSIQQYRLARRLGDESIISRCKLYYALSLIQKGEYYTAASIIREQYKLAKGAVIKDIRLIKMCLGIWSKLKYEYRKNKNNKINCSQ